jgi:hypothetical protein
MTTEGFSLAYRYERTKPFSLIRNVSRGLEPKGAGSCCEVVGVVVANGFCALAFTGRIAALQRCPRAALRLWVVSAPYSMLSQWPVDSLPNR